MAAGSDRFIGALLGGTYRVVRMIGKGGMGAIYEASHARLRGNRYAIKVLAPRLADEPELLVRFRREAEIASQLGHEHIVTVHDFNVSDGNAYMVMELLEGEDLAAHVQARGALSLDEVKRIVDQVASALDAAHRAQIVHRDLKPQNLFLCRRAGHNHRDHVHVKVLDFGVSKVLDSSSVVTGDHALLGTPFYMSPEQADGRVQEIDARTDVFALGAIIWEMLTGQMAFAAPTLSAALYKVCSVDPPEVHRIRRDAPPALSLVLQRALAKDRQQRTPSVVQLAAEFAAALGGAASAAAAAVGALTAADGFVAVSHAQPAMAAGGAAAVPPPRTRAGWPSAAERSPGLMPTLPSLSGAPLPASGAGGALAPAGSPSASVAGPATGSIAGSVAGPVAGSMAASISATSPATSALAVGSMVAQRRPLRWGVVAAAAGSLVVGLGVWAAVPRDRAGAQTARGASGASVTAPSATESSGVAAAPNPVETTGPPRSEAPATEATAAPLPPARPVTPTEVALFLSVEPASAKPRITLGDAVLTERLIHVPRSDTPRTLTAEARGFVAVRRDVVPDRDQTIAIILQRKAIRAPAAHAPAAAMRDARDPVVPKTAASPQRAPEPARQAAVQPAPGAASATAAPQVGAPAPRAQPPGASTKPAVTPEPPKKSTGTVFDQ